MVDQGTGDWASETTQQQMLKAIQDAFKLDKKQSKSVVDTLKKIDKEGGVATKGTRKAFSELTKGLKASASEAMDSAAGFDKLRGPMRGFGDELKKANMGFKTAAAGVGLLATGIGRAIAIYKENVDSIRALTEQGLRIENSFSGILETLADTGMSLEQFNELTTKYARVIGQNGLNAFTDLITSTREQIGGFKTLGLTTAEATEFAAEYLQQQRMAGIFAGATQAEQTQALKENLRELNLYSKVMKVSRSDIQAQTSAMLGRDDLQRMFFTMAPEERRKAQASFTTISNMMGGMGEGGAALLELFTDMAAAPIAETSESFKTLAAYSPELAQEMLRLVDLQRAGGKVEFSHIKNLMSMAGASKDLITSFAIAGGESEQAANLLAKIGMSAEEADAMLERERENYRASLKEGEEATEDGFLAFLGQTDANASGMANLEEGANKLAQTFNRGMVEATNKVIESFLGEGALADTADALGDALIGVADRVNDWIDDLTKTDNLAEFIIETLSSVIQDMTIKITTAIRDLVPGLNEASGVVTDVLDVVSGNAQSSNFAMADSQTRFSMATQTALARTARTATGGYMGVGSAQMGMSAQLRQMEAGGPSYEDTKREYERMSGGHITLSPEQFRELKNSVRDGAREGLRQAGEVN